MHVVITKLFCFIVLDPQDSVLYFLATNLQVLCPCASIPIYKQSSRNLNSKVSSLIKKGTLFNHLIYPWTIPV